GGGEVVDADQDGLPRVVEQALGDRVGRIRRAIGDDLLVDADAGHFHLGVVLEMAVAADHLGQEDLGGARLHAVAHGPHALWFGEVRPVRFDDRSTKNDTRHVGPPGLATIIPVQTARCARPRAEPRPLLPACPNTTTRTADRPWLSARRAPPRPSP